jgi:hypothetical protein
MKLSPQLAGVSLIESRPEPAPARCANTFAVTVRELIAATSNNPTSQVISDGSDIRHSKVPVRVGVLIPRSGDLDLSICKLPEAAAAQPKIPPATRPDTDTASQQEITEEASGKHAPVPPALPKGGLEREVPVPGAQNPAAPISAFTRSPVRELGSHHTSGANTQSDVKLNATSKANPHKASTVAAPHLPDTLASIRQILPQGIGALVPMQLQQRPETSNPQISAQMPNGQVSARVHSEAVMRRPGREDESFSSALAGARSQGHNPIGLPNEVHSLKETGKDTSPVAQLINAERPPVYSSIATHGIQHQAVSNSAVTAPATEQGRAETHHALSNVTEVLQKMDMAAPSDAVQLRADTRHLDVGFSSVSLGWVEVRATASQSGRVDAALHLETNASAHLVADQSKEIADYAREHLVELGQLSVGVGTGDGSRGNRGSMNEPGRENNGTSTRRAVTNPVTGETASSAEKLSLINIRA